jgi:hypothetical protein
MFTVQAGTRLVGRRWRDAVLEAFRQKHVLLIGRLAISVVAVL